MTHTPSAPSGPASGREPQGRTGSGDQPQGHWSAASHGQALPRQASAYPQHAGSAAQQPQPGQAGYRHFFRTQEYGRDRDRAEQAQATTTQATATRATQMAPGLSEPANPGRRPGSASAPSSAADHLQWPETPRALWERLHRPASLKRELIIVVVMALAISMVMKTFFVQTFTIPSGSMENTLQVGDRIMVNRMSDPSHLQRGDIIVFEDPGGWIEQESSSAGLLAPLRRGLEFVGVAPVSKGHLVKRVIGLPGDHVVCCDAQRRMTINGQPVSEPYLYPGELASREYFDITVPAGRLWVMGDHRSVSGDSRVHLPSGSLVPQERAVRNPSLVQPVSTAGVHQATVPQDLVVGKVFWRLWPPSRFGRM